MSEKWNIFGSDMFKIEVACIKLSKMLYNLTKILKMLDKIWVCVLHRKVSVSSTVNSVEKKMQCILYRSYENNSLFGQSVVHPVLCNEYS